MIRIRQLKINILENSEEKLLLKASKLLNIKLSQILSYTIVKQSIDARKKDNVFYVYELDIEVENEEELLKKNKNKDVFLAPLENYQFPNPGQEIMQTRPVIIGSGPAGLFCAYLLAEHGYFPIVIERGEKLENRVKTVEKFWKTGELNQSSNVQFGEGGAGTFSDGKLNTLVKDKFHRGKKVFEIFVENNAPADIMYLNKPHIGTDILRTVIKSMRTKIISMGGEFRYNTQLTNIIVKENTLTAIELNNKEVMPCTTLVLAIGHSARDTFKMLNDNNIIMKAKPFAVGVRIEHSQELINKSQYGEKFYKLLPPASYKLTYTTKEKRGVYSFCMCPGGYVVNASSEKNKLAINGMSNHARDTKNANSAIVVTVTPKDFGNDPLAGIAFQRKLEALAFDKGKGKIPLQLYKDFKNNKTTTTLGIVTPIIKGSYNFANLNEILPSYISESLKEAIPEFAKRIKGYDHDDVILSAIESRTSSPVKIERNEEGISNIKGIYPCGEGAGYAGGITSAAMDGIKIAESISKKFSPYRKI